MIESILGGKNNGLLMVWGAGGGGGVNEQKGWGGEIVRGI